jgi:N-acetylated-alpha-linked acidic dipeptidase
VVVARYGRSFRGIKAREAERRGAAALLIYSDPADDGYVRGDVYPEGPMRPAFGVQRGSVYNGNGDPTTPGYPSTAGARRRPLDSLAVPRIPVVPISYGNAQKILADVRGAAVPQAWQGGLPFRYHAGPAPRGRGCAWPTTAGPPARARTRPSRTRSASPAAPSCPTSSCSWAGTATAGARARPTT